MTRCMADLLTWINRKTYEAKTKKSLVQGALAPLPVDPNAWNLPHPLQEEMQKRVLANLVSLAKDDNAIFETIGYGDSILAGMRGFSVVLLDRCNMSIAGSWAHHMSTMISFTFPVIHDLKLYPKIKHVIIGTLGGNPFLQGQPVDITLEKSIETLNLIRTSFPNSRIIVYGLPPTVFVEANLKAIPFEFGLYQWCLMDYNSVFIPLQRKFTRWGIFPKAIMTSDGVHFSERGKYEFDELLKKAKTARARSLVQ